MIENQPNPKDKPHKDVKTSRASVSFTPELYATLQRIAEEKKVSVAWIVREASEKYVNEQWPLFAENSRKKQLA